VRCLGTDKAAETAARRDRGGLLEGGNGGGMDKMNGRVLFYSRTLHGGNVGLRKEVEREVMAWHGGRAMRVHARVARCNSDVAVAATSRGGDAEGICPYAIGEEVSWTVGGWWWPRGTHRRASACCLGARREGYAPALTAHF
jgi:hypothetical protein